MNRIEDERLIYQDGLGSEKVELHLTMQHSATVVIFPWL